MASSRLAATGFSLRPTGIACGTACTENHTTRTSVTLTAAPATFIGWDVIDRGDVANFSMFRSSDTVVREGEIRTAGSRRKAQSARRGAPGGRRNSRQAAAGSGQVAADGEEQRAAGRERKRYAPCALR